ncbi:MAG TPA: AAA family ATPase, partial [Amycolatopsis sp.]|nr:AAA family ATPase [Amycolatopsis sp.]
MSATTICAPAGFGKTTLLASWAHNTRASAPANVIAWLNLDEGDNDASSLRRGVLAALAHAVGVAPGWLVDDDVFVPALAEVVQRQPDGVWLVLDDVHALTARSALDVLETLLRLAPANLRVVLCGRRMPDVGLHRLRIEGRLRQVRAADLAFTAEEAAQVISADGVRLSDADLARVIALAQGWPAAVRLAAIALNDRDRRTGTLEYLVTADRAVTDYVNREVMSEFSDDQRDFLIATCICETFGPALATELTGRADAPRVLQSLVGFEALVSSAGRAEEHRQHPFVRAHLSAQLRRHAPAAFARLHSIAARWHAARNEPATAAKFAVRADDPALAAELLRDHGLPLLLRGDPGLLRTLAATLSPEQVAQPEVGLILATAEFVVGERATAELRLSGLTDTLADDASAALQDLELIVRTHWARLTGRAVPAIEELGSRVARIANPDLRILALVNRGTALYWLGQHQAAGPDLEQAMRMAAARRYDLVVLHCLSHLSGVASAEGDFPQMHRMARQALRFAEERGPALQSACCYANAIAAWAAYQFLDSREAASLANKAIELLGPGNDRTVELCVLLVREAIDFDLGAEPHAALLRMRRHWANVDRDQPVQPTLLAYSAPVEQRMALRLGRADWALEVERRAALRLGESGDVYLLRARLHAHHGRVVAARNLLERITRQQVRSHVVLTRIEAHLLAATLADRAADRRAARSEVRAAIELAAPRRALRPFYDAGPDVRRLLVPEMGRLGPLDRFVEELLEAIPPAQPGVAAELTPREVQLLRELPSLATIEEIAAALY